MKNLLFIFSFFIAFPLLAQDDDNSYVMYRTMLLTPIHGHGQQLQEGLKAHNAKFHVEEGPYQVNVWSINSGARTGSLSWVQGPLTWTDFDTSIPGDKHMDDWRANVAPHAIRGEWEYWRLASEMSYMPEGLAPKLFQVRYFDIKNEKANNAREIFGRLFKAYKDNNLDIGMQVFTNQVNEDNGKDWAILWFHDSWASLDKDRDFVAKYEKMYGDDSWDEFFEVWREVADYTGMEIQVLQGELSAAGNN